MNTKQLIGAVLDTTLKIVIIIAVIMFVYKYAIEAYDFGYRVFAEEPVTAKADENGEDSESAENVRSISIAVTEDATPMDIGKVLEQKGLIRDARLFYVQELLSAYHSKLKPGIYELRSDMTAEEMLAVMGAEPVEEESGEDESSQNDPLEEDSEGTDPEETEPLEEEQNED